MRIKKELLLGVVFRVPMIVCILVFFVGLVMVNFSLSTKELFNSLIVLVTVVLLNEIAFNMVDAFFAQNYEGNFSVVSKFLIEGPFFADGKKFKVVLRDVRNNQDLEIFLKKELK
ncbi:hypothetical protein ACFL08_02375 [Patescibacteria group bacterium]